MGKMAIANGQASFHVVAAACTISHVLRVAYCASAGKIQAGKAKQFHGKCQKRTKLFELNKVNDAGSKLPPLRQSIVVLPKITQIPCRPGTAEHCCHRRKEIKE